MNVISNIAFKKKLHCLTTETFGVNCPCKICLEISRTNELVAACIIQQYFLLCSGTGPAVYFVQNTERNVVIKAKHVKKTKTF